MARARKIDEEEKELRKRQEEERDAIRQKHLEEQVCGTLSGCFWLVATTFNFLKTVLYGRWGLQRLKERQNAVWPSVLLTCFKKQNSDGQH